MSVSAARHCLCVCFNLAPEGRREGVDHSPQLVLMCGGILLCRVQPAVVLLCTTAIFFLAETIHAEPLLTCVVAGAVTTNRRWAVTQGLMECAYPCLGMLWSLGLHAWQQAASFARCRCCCSKLIKKPQSNAWCPLDS